MAQENQWKTSREGIVNPSQFLKRVRSVNDKAYEWSSSDENKESVHDWHANFSANLEEIKLEI